MKKLIKPGARFGRLVVIREVPVKKWQTHHLCLCDCGNETTVLQNKLTSERTKSCGCLRHESYAKTHGMTGTKEYNCYMRILARCNNPNPTDRLLYGGRGISCDFADFREFYLHIGPAPSDGKRYSVDRIDTNGNYAIGNVRWATDKQQANNKRNNRLLTLHGETKTLREWSDALGIKYPTLNSRVQRGWDDEKSLTTGTPNN